MGLIVSHGCFTGSYSAFNRFRKSVAGACGGSFPPHAPGLIDDDGNPFDETCWYYEPDVVPPKYRDGMFVFLNHPDNKGELDPDTALKVAMFLSWAAPRMMGEASGHLAYYGSMAGVARQFMIGCRMAARQGESVEFC